MDWNRFKEGLIDTSEHTEYLQSSFSSEHGDWILVEDQWGDHAWRLKSSGIINEKLSQLSDGFESQEFVYFPASFENLVRLKNLIQESDPENNAFPTSRENLENQPLE